MNLFRKKSLEHISSLTHLESAVTVVGIKGWLVLLFFILLTAAVMIWAVMGHIPITASGKCIVMDSKSTVNIFSNVTATVKEIKVTVGSQVKKDEVLVVLEDPLLDQKIAEQRVIVSFLQDEIKQIPSSSQIENMKLQLLIEEERLKDLEANKQHLLILSPIDATISWIHITEDSRVTPEMRMMSLQGEFFPDTLKVLGFVSLYSGQQIKPGMDVKISLDTVNTAKYGTIRGKVEQVLIYPVDLEGYYSQKIPSESLRKYLINGPLPTILVIITPILDEDTISRFAWTSKTGAPIHIEPGIIGAFRVTLDSITPISYVLPSIAKE